MGETKQFRKRNAILSCLRCTDQHPSAETLHQMLQQEHPDISLATVYRNLAFFKSQGMIASLGAVNGVERFEANVQPHVHFICGCCGGEIYLGQLYYEMDDRYVCPECLGEYAKSYFLSRQRTAMLPQWRA